jgi:hypothetical protein
MRGATLHVDRRDLRERRRPMAKLARQHLANEEVALELVANFPTQFWDDVANRTSRLIKQLIEDCLEAKRV